MGHPDGRRRRGAIGVTAVLLLCLSQARAGTVTVVSPCVPSDLSASGHDADECAGIFAPLGTGTLKNKAATLNGTDGTGIGPLWGGEWEELAVYENGGGTGLGFSIDEASETWSVESPLYGDFVIGIKQSTEVAFYFFSKAAGTTGGRFRIDPNFKGSGFSDARIYGRKKPRAAIRLDKQAGATVANADQTFTVPITLTIENPGEEDLISLQIDDDLNIFGQGHVVAVSQIEVLAGALSPNPGYDGVHDTTLLLGTDKLRSSATARLRFTVTFDPGGEPGPFVNRATAQGVGKSSHQLVSGDAQAVISLPAVPAIALTKQIGQIQPLGDGTFNAPVILTVDNHGTEPLNNIGIDDNLDIFTPGGRLIGVSALASSTLTVNTAYNGLSNIHVLAGSDALPVGQQASVTFAVHFACDPGSGPFKNSATATGSGLTTTTSVSAKAHADIACQAPAPVPAIALTKQIGQIQPLGDGTFNAPVILTVRNTGGEALINLELEDPLGIFGTGKIVAVSGLSSSSLTINPRFDGTSDTHVLTGADALPVGASGEVAFTVVFNPGSEAGPFTNRASAGATGGESGEAASAEAEADIVLPAVPPPPPPPVTATRISGVIYDSSTRTGLSATAVFADANGAALPGVCLGAGQQGQTTPDGNYRFDVHPGADAACPAAATVYRLVVTPPTGYSQLPSAAIPPEPVPLIVAACPIDPDPTPPCKVQSQPQPPATGQPSKYYLRFEVAANDQDVVNNHVAMDATPPPPIAVTKTADRSQVTRGEAVAYDVRVDNTGNAVISDVEVLDDLPDGFRLVDGSASLIEPGPDGTLHTADDRVTPIMSSGTDPVSFGPFDLPANGSFLIRYLARAGTGIGQGDYTNTVTVLVDGAVAGIPPATATVSLVPDPVFEQATVIGKVFDDRNGDGIQQPGEPGIPGVRLATATGLVVETDAYGRYHLAAIDIARFERGANFILKVDTTTLPSGATMISENPRVIRLTEAELSRINFAVSLPEAQAPQATLTTCTEECTTTITRAVRGQVPPVRFATGSWSISADYIAKLRALVNAYRDRRNVRLSFIGHTDSDPIHGNLARDLGAGEAGNLELSRRRARAVCVLVRDTGGLPADCDRIEGRGSSEPVDRSGTPEAKALNRRVEIELRYDETKTNPQTRVLACPAPTGSDGTASGVLPKVPSEAVASDCKVRISRSDRSSAAASDIRVSGGPFGCAGWTGRELKGRSDKKAPPATLTVVADPATVVPGQQCEHGIKAGEFPIEVRTAEGSVHYVSRTGDVTRQAFPLNSRQWIVVTPFRDETDNTTVTALRISNLGVEQQQRVTQASEGASVSFTVDPGIRDPRLDVLALNAAVLDRSGRLTDDVRFAGYSNYAAFIRAYKLEIRGRSSTGARLLRTIRPDNIRFGADIRFDGTDDNGRPIDLRQYATIEYVLEAFSCNQPDGGGICQTDVTRPRLLTMLDSPPLHDVARMADELWGQSNLAQQRIRVDGSRVRIHGADFTAGGTVTVNGQPVPVGADGRFVLEQHLKAGTYDYTVAATARGDDRSPDPAMTWATGITVSGGLFGCNRSVTGRPLPGRDPAGDIRETPAVTVVANLTTEAAGCPQPPGVYLTVKTHEGTVLQLTREGDIVRSSEPDNGQRIVITPFRDATDNTVVTALRIANEGFTDLSRLENRYEFSVRVDDDYKFVVALANLTIGKNNVSGDPALLAGDPHFDGSTFTDGRLALYAKSRFKQKYGLTAQLDTTEDEIKNLVDDLRRKEPYRLFRQLDSKRYYATYGDDSTTISDVDTQGAFYMRLDWDRNEALLGNFNTGLTDTELMQYDRSLFGANLNLETNATTAFGDAKRQLKVFGSEAQSVPAHVTFRATGGSLYYLKHTDIVEGSEKLWIEVRRRDTEQVLEREVLLEGRDYEIDPIQGRIILRRPLSQVANDSSTSIIRTRALEGDEVFLLADYEYVPQSFSADNLTSGVRGKAWIGDHVALGATQVTDQRTGVDYDLHGLDLTVKLGTGTYFTAEAAGSKARQNEASFVSSDGGLTFGPQASTAASNALAGDAVALEGRVDLGEISNNRLAGNVRAWHKTRDAEFSTGRLDDGVETHDNGVEAHFRAGQRLTVTTGYTELERALVSRQTTARVQADGNFGRLTAGLELRREDLARLGSDPVTGLTAAGTSGEALLVGARLGYSLADKTTVYATAQTTADDRGAYQKNDLVSVGVKRQLNDTFALNLEASDGDRGKALTSGVDLSVHGLNFNVSSGVGPGAVSQFSTSYSVAEGRELYGSYAVNPDRTDGQRNLLTLGQRRAFGNHLDIFTESQFGKNDRYASVAHVFGLDFNATQDWRIRGSVEYGDNRDNADGIARQAVSLGAYRQTRDLKLSSRVEYREDEGNGLHTKQYLTSNSFAKRVTDSRRWLGNLNVSWTDDALNGGREAGYAELDIGHAYRPVTNDRLNLIAKYSYLYDLVGVDQKAGQSDERSHLISLDTIYELTPHWEIGGKLAVKQGEQRVARDRGPWLDLNLRLATVHARYNVTKMWDALGEYRWLSDGDTTRRGVLVGAYRHLGGRFKVGVGYNFTDFNDDLRNDGYNNRGWFIDLVGKY